MNLPSICIHGCDSSFPRKITRNPEDNIYIFDGLESVGHSFAYVVHFIVLIDVRIRNQRAAVASGRAINLANHRPTFGSRYQFRQFALIIINKVVF